MTSRETILPLQALARNGNQQRIIDWISAQPRLQVLSVLALSITPWDILPPVKFWNWAAWKNKTRIIDRFINDVPLSYYCSNLVEDESNANTFHYAANHLGVLGRLLDHFYANMADETMLRGCLQSITSFDDTPFTIVLHHLIQEQRGLENSTEADDYDPYEEEQQLIDHYNQVADFLSSRRGGRFLSISMVGSGLNHKDMYEGYRGDIKRFLEDQYDQLSDNRISDMIYNKLDSLDYYSEEEEEDPILPIPELGTYYTLNEFRRMTFPIEENRLTFNVPGEDLDCDIGDYEATKYMPVKLDVERTSAAKSGERITRHNWDVDGSGKLYLFCAQELKQWVNTKVPNYGRNYNINPFNRKKIVGIQYLTQVEITADQAISNWSGMLSHLLRSENNNDDNRKKTEEEANDKAFSDSKQLLVNNSMLTILRRRLAATRRLLTELLAKNTRVMSNDQRSMHNDEIVGARNRIPQLEAMIAREEAKERRLRRLEELKRKGAADDGPGSKRRRKKLYLTLGKLKF